MVTTFNSSSPDRLRSPTPPFFPMGASAATTSSHTSKATVRFLPEAPGLRVGASSLIVMEMLTPPPRWDEEVWSWCLLDQCGTEGCKRHAKVKMICGFPYPVNFLYVQYSSA